MFPVVARSIVRNVVTPNAADVFIFSWDPGLADMYNVTYKPVSARYEPNAPLQPRFEELCRRSRGPCLWQALSWAYALAEGFELAARGLRHLVADPLLPAEIHPPDWPASALRNTYERYNRAYRARLSAFFRSRSRVAG